MNSFVCAVFLICILCVWFDETKAVDYSSCGDWEQYKDEKCFKIFVKVGLQTNEDAKNTCQQQENSSSLVSIRSQEEQEFLSNLLFKTFQVVDNVWIGAKYTNNKFKWIDDSDLSFTNWNEHSPSNQTDRNCVQISKFTSFAFYSPDNSNEHKPDSMGKWVDVPCRKKNLVLCQKMQNWSVFRLQKTLLNVRKELRDSLEDVRKELSDSRNQLDKTKNQLHNTRNELSDTQHEMVNTKSQLSDIRNELNDTQIELKRMINQRLEGVEGAFMSSFEVGGSIKYYYPVEFRIHSQGVDRSNPRTPLMYDIYRRLDEKAPESLNTGTVHYMALTLKLMSTDGGCYAGANVLKVLLHQWIYNKGVAKVQLFGNIENRIFVWLRGGGILYHIRSPIDLTQKITIYLEDNAVAAPVYQENGTQYPAVIVSPIAVGSEDPNLVKTGAYDGWGF